MTSGTAMRLRPVDTVNVTVVPTSVSVPGPGVVSMTWFSGTSSLASRRSRTLKPSFFSSSVAARRPSPSTLGTPRWPGPEETVSATVEPLSARLLACGSCRMTASTGVSASGTRSMLTSKPALCSTAAAAADDLPTTLGTTIFSGRVNANATAPPMRRTTSASTTHGQRRGPWRSSSYGGGGATGGYEPVAAPTA